MLGLKLTTADPQSSLFPTECPLSLGMALFLDLTIAYPFSFPTSRPSEDAALPSIGKMSVTHLVTRTFRDESVSLCR